MAKHGQLSGINEKCADAYKKAGAFFAHDAHTFNVEKRLKHMSVCLDTREIEEELEKGSTA